MKFSIARSAFAFAATFAVLSTAKIYASTFGPEIIVSTRDQAMAVIEKGAIVARFKVSTSKYGVGDDPRSYKTPLGALFVCNKIGDNLPLGAVIHGRAFTGEILKPNAPGRDPIVSRVIWLRGIEPQNRHAYDRCIYIHGTAEEKNIGKAVSFGCVRMKSKDVIALYDLVRIGTRVTISDQPLKRVVIEEERTLAGAN
jgi:lipoprotein-anchoring transpeptidase ErfK/SrfK